MILAGGGLPSDDYNRADSATTLNTSSSGHAWTALAGTWGITSNAGYLPSGANESVAYLEASDADVTIEVKCTGTSLSRQGLAFRVVDINNFLIWYFIGGNIQCWKQVANGWTQIASAAVTAAQNDIIKVVLSGTSIDLYHNGSLKASITESAHQTATKHGMYWEVGGSAAVRWDDFSVT